jgi:hypothetical protein
MKSHVTLLSMDKNSSYLTIFVWMIYTQKRSSERLLLVNSGWMDG